MESELYQSILEFLRTEFASVIKSKLTKGHKLKNFKINPFVLTALSSGILGEQTPKNMAKALLYPRVLGTSISTTFGECMQRLCTKYLGASPSAIQGMDIEFIDKVTDKKVYMQLKSGPNNINAGDVEPVVSKMNKAYRLFQKNGIGEMPVFAIGILYGTIDDISGHYKNIQASTVGAQPNIPIYIGQDFWYRITGNSNFYSQMMHLFIELFEQEDYSVLLQEDLVSLQNEIELKYFTNGKFDVGKI